MQVPSKPEPGDFITLDSEGKDPKRYGARWFCSSVVAVIGDTYFMAYDEGRRGTTIPEFTEVHIKLKSGKRRYVAA